MTATSAAAVLAAVDAEANLQHRIVEVLLAALRRLWESLDPWSPSSVESFAGAAGAVTARARLQASGTADAYLRHTLSLQGVQSTGRAQAPNGLPRGIPLAEEWARPAAQARFARSQGADESAALNQGLTRALVIGETDTQLARRDAYQARLVSADRVVGFRRVIHPELSRGGTCGLCIAAADRKYKRDDLLPLHARCACTVAPLVDGSADTGHALNTQALQELYARAGSTGRQDLAKVRYVVHTNGELGPVLANEGDHFRGPAEVARAA